MGTSRHLVVGGGVSGMLQALLLANRKHDVVLVERTSDLGGLFKSMETPFGPLDHGIHILYETGIEEIDRLVHDLLSPAEWILLEGQRKDIAGNYFRGRLNVESIFADVRDLDRPAYLRALGDFFASHSDNAPGFADSASLAEYLRQRFGGCLFDEVLAPISRKVWKLEPSLMSAWAARIVHMTRLVMFDEPQSLRLKSIPTLDRVIAYPNQLRLPKSYLSTNLKGLYPKRFGMVNIVEALKSALTKAGVRIVTSAQIESIKVEAGVACTANVRECDGSIKELSVSNIVWTSPIQALAPLFNMSFQRPPDNPLKTYTVFLFLADPPEMGELYYFLCFDPVYATFRVANFAAFCPAAAGPYGYPVSVELHFGPSEDLSENDIEAIAISEAIALGVVNSKQAVRHVYRHEGYGGFFVPSLRNLRAVAEAFEITRNNVPPNVFVTAPDISKGSFYLQDALLSAHARLSTIRQS